LNINATGSASPSGVPSTAVHRSARRYAAFFTAASRYARRSRVVRTIPPSKAKAGLHSSRRFLTPRSAATVAAMSSPLPSPLPWPNCYTPSLCLLQQGSRSMLRRARCRCHRRGSGIEDRGDHRCDLLGGWRRSRGRSIRRRHRYKPATATATTAATTRDVRGMRRVRAVRTVGEQNTIVPRGCCQYERVWRVLFIARPRDLGVCGRDKQPTRRSTSESCQDGRTKRNEEGPP